MGLTADFIKLAGDVWTRAQMHQFVEELGAGTLDLDKFKFYLLQDYVYLKAYCRAVALLCYRAPDLETMSAMSALLHSTLTFEMETHRNYAAEFGITREELEAAKPAPTTLAYSSYMLDVATREDFLGNLVCLLPCAVGYAEIGKRLSSGRASADNPFHSWIETYSSDEFLKYAGEMSSLADMLAAGCAGSRLDGLFAIFLSSTKYEWLFWEMAYRAERWPV